MKILKCQVQKVTLDQKGALSALKWWECHRFWWQNRISFPLWLIKALSMGSRVDLIKECLIHSVVLNAV